VIQKKMNRTKMQKEHFIIFKKTSFIDGRTISLKISFWLVNSTIVETAEMFYPNVYHL